MNKQLHSTDPLTVLDGIGAVKSSRFAALGVTNLGELCELFPKSYRQNKVTRLIDAVPAANAYSDSRRATTAARQI